MNFILIFCDQEIKIIATRYYDSTLVGYSNGKALKQSYDKALEELDTKNRVCNGIKIM